MTLIKQSITQIVDDYRRTLLEGGPPREGKPGSGAHHNKPGRRGGGRKASDVVTIFHGTSHYATDEIKKEGIKPVPWKKRIWTEFRKRGEQSTFYEGERIKAIFLTKTSEEAWIWAERGASMLRASIAAVVEAKIPKSWFEKLKKDDKAGGDAWYYLGKIPAKYIKKIAYRRIWDYFPDTDLSAPAYWEEVINEAKEEFLTVFIPIIIKEGESVTEGGPPRDGNPGSGKHHNKPGRWGNTQPKPDEPDTNKKPAEPETKELAPGDVEDDADCPLARHSTTVKMRLEVLQKATIGDFENEEAGCMVKDVLGNPAYDLFTGGKTSVQIALGTAQRMELFLHTHPDNVPFSANDMGIFHKYPNSKRFEVVTPDGTLYSITKTARTPTYAGNPNGAHRESNRIWVQSKRPFMRYYVHIVKTKQEELGRSLSRSERAVYYRSVLEQTLEEYSKKYHLMFKKSRVRLTKDEATKVSKEEKPIDGEYEIIDDSELLDIPEVPYHKKEENVSESLFEEDEIDRFWLTEQKSITGADYDPDPVRQAFTSTFLGMGGFDKASYVIAKREFDNLKSRFSSRLAGLLARVQEGSLSPNKAIDDFRDTLRESYQEAFRLGGMRAGNPFYREQGITGAEQRFVALAAGTEQNFLAGAVRELHDRKSRLPAGLRAEFFARSLDAQFWNGLLSGGFGEGVQIHWKLGRPITGHCPECLEINAHSPYTLDTLPTVPRAGDTSCLFRCYCSLVLIRPEMERGGFESTENIAPRARSTGLESLSCIVKSTASGARPPASVQETLSDLFDEMYTLRAKMAITTGAEKAIHTAARKMVNAEIIRLSDAFKVRAVPLYSVPDIVKKAQSLQAQGLKPVKSVWRCP